jgi:hypothetical protein
MMKEQKSQVDIDESWNKPPEDVSSPLPEDKGYKTARSTTSDLALSLLLGF